MKKASLLILTLLILIVAGMLAPTPVKALDVILEIEEQTVPDKGMKFNVTIFVENVEQLVAYGITLVWNPGICNYTGTVGLNPPPDRIWGGNEFERLNASALLVGRIDNTAGTIVGITQVITGMEGATGNFSLVTVEFYAKEFGDTDLDFSGDTGLENILGYNVTFTRRVGDIIIVPEFPAHLLMPLFLIVTIIAIVLAKTAWSKKPRGRVDVK